MKTPAMQGFFAKRTAETGDQVPFFAFWGGKQDRNRLSVPIVRGGWGK